MKKEQLTKVSIVMEFENFRIGGASRTKRTIDQLAGEISELAKAGSIANRLPIESVELLLIYEEGEADISLDVLPTELNSSNFVTPRLIGCTNSAYYMQKNIGAEKAAGDIVVFLDSDTPPEAGWLQSLLSPFVDTSVNWTAGISYMEGSNFYERAFGMFWYFPPRPKDRHQYKAQSLFANNFAARREAFLQYKFRDLGAVSRGACRELGDRFEAEGVWVHTDTCAMTAHPPPKWPMGFFRVHRAFPGKADLIFRKK